MEGNLRFQIDCTSIVGSKFTVLAYCFTLYLRAVFQVQSPPPPGGGVYLEGWFNRGFFALPFWGLIHGGAYFWNFTVIIY